MVKFIEKNIWLISGALLAYLVLMPKKVKAKGSITLSDYTWNDAKTDYILLPTGSSYAAGEILGKILPDPLGLNFVIFESKKNKNIFHSLDPETFKRFFDYSGKLPTDK